MYMMMRDSSIDSFKVFLSCLVCSYFTFKTCMHSLVSVCVLSSVNVCSFIVNGVLIN